MNSIPARLSLYNTPMFGLTSIFLFVNPAEEPGIAYKISQFWQK